MFSLKKTSPKNKDKGLQLYEDVARMLINFKDNINEDHGKRLLRTWDVIREKYDNG